MNDPQPERHMASHIGRREFLATLLGGAVAAWPLAPRAQQAKMPTIAVLGTASAAAWGPWTAAFVLRLRELGWIDGRTVAIKYRWADGRNERFAEIAAEFVALKADVILTSGGPAFAAKQATSTIPIVSVILPDPVGSGLVASLARPGGNLAGLSIQLTDLAGKRLELLREVVPGLRHPGSRAVVRGGIEADRCPRRGRDRARSGCLRGQPQGWPDHHNRLADIGASRADHHTCGSPPTAGDLLESLLRRQRRPHLVRPRSGRPVPPRGRLRRSHPQGREAGRPTGASADQVRAGDQPQDREGARPHCAR